MNSISKKIKALPLSYEAQEILPPPTPSKRLLPDWYKKTISNISGSKDKIISSKGGINLTIKSCIPVFDSMSAGYFIVLPCDIQIVDEHEFSGQRIVWSAQMDVASSHPLWQIGEMSIPKEYDQAVFKWNAFWQIETPKGYSLLVVHPMYHFDLPFYTLPAIIDTDVFENFFNMPFFLKKDFVGIIKRGTPIAQVIPIKRDSWSLQIKKFNKKVLLNSNKKLLFLSNFYRKFFWQKKNYN